MGKLIEKYVFILMVFLSFVLPASAKTIKICASLPDLASIASYIGGSKVEVFSIAKNNSNVHSIEVLPSYMIRVSKCKIFLKAGLSLDQWADQIIDGARNNNLFVVDCSNGINVLQKPIGKIDASLGDVHSQGNPHYWLDPKNSFIISHNILEILKKIDPQNSEFYNENYKKFRIEMETKLAIWKKQMSQLFGAKIICYHSSWVYFALAFNLNIIDYVEPYPGIPPTGKHLNKLINAIKSENIKILIQESYFSDAGPKFLERETGIKIFKANPSCNDVKADSYFKHFDDIVFKLSQK